MTEKPLVSVIINCYNGEKYLRETIDSVIAQTYENWELVFWDNQSTDSTREIVESYKNPKIRYFYAPKHTPLGEARNLAIERANGDILGFLDADDVWTPNCIEVFRLVFGDYPNVGLVYSKFYSKTDKTGWTSQGGDTIRIVPLSTLVDHYNIGMSSAFFKKSVIINHNIRINNEFSLIEDYDFYLRIASFTDVLFIPDVLMIYRVYEGNNTSKGDFALEYKMLYELILNDSKYSNLKPHVSFIEKGRRKYEIIQAIRDGERMTALKLILQAIPYDLSAIKYFVSLVIGKRTSSVYRSIIERFKLSL